jgi:NADH-quinone oxidoreductase subunit A
VPVVNPYVPVMVSIAIAVVFSIAFVMMSKLFGPHRPTRTKRSMYECGMPSIAPAHQRFSVKFYLVAVLFILFDLEAVFLFPWSVVLRTLTDTHLKTYVAGTGPFMLVEMFFFLGVLFLGWVYCLKRGALQWD